MDWQNFLFYLGVAVMAAVLAVLCTIELINAEKKEVGKVIATVVLALLAAWFLYRSFSFL